MEDTERSPLERMIIKQLFYLISNDSITLMMNFLSKQLKGQACYLTMLKHHLVLRHTRQRKTSHTVSEDG